VRNQVGDDLKSQVLQAVDIVELVGRSVALKRRGKDYVGLCPFHQEKTPSFTVSPARQFFHCYGCKAGGNAIDFVIARDRLEFRDALRLLAEQAGIDPSAFGGASREKTGERQALLEANSAACAYFESLLDDPARGEAGRQYLQQRGISTETAKRFRVGLAADGWDGLLKALAGRKFTPAQLTQSGLVKQREKGGGYYDTFRNRLMFPIRDENGRVIAFGGRAMPGSQDPAAGGASTAKYLNSPETPLFSKGRCVFALDLARQKIVEARTAVVVEGYTDVLMAHQFGVANVVSVLGTAMTEQHLGLLRRFADRIILLFDADTAGDAAANKAVGLFLTQPVEIAIASMPPGVDPDEYLLRNGAEAFGQLLAGAVDALTYKWKQLSRRFAQDDGLTGRQKAVEEYLQTLAGARVEGPVDPLRWGAALARVSRLTDIPAEELGRRFRARDAKPQRSQGGWRGDGGPRGRFAESRGADARRGSADGAGEPAPGEAAGPGPNGRLLTARHRVERWILGCLLVRPRHWERVQRLLGADDFTDPPHRRLAEIYWHYQRDEGEPVFNEFLGILKEPDLTALAVEVVDEVEAMADLDQTLDEAMAHLEWERRLWKEQKLLADLRRTSQGAATPGDAAVQNQDEVALLKQLQENARRPDLRRV